MLQFFKKTASEICPKTEAKNDPKMESTWMPNGAKMEVKGHPIINVFFDGFPKASGNIDGTASKPRRVRGGSAANPRVSHFLQPTPQGGAIFSKDIVQQ